MSGLVEQPLLDALYRYCPNPTEEEALECLRDERIQNAAVAIGEEMRRIAIREDDERQAQKKTLINYRRFYVGGVGIGLVMSSYGHRRQHPYDWFAFAAFNTKPSKKVKKFCLEMRVMRGARSVLCSCLGGVVVIGERQPDGRSGVHGPTLDPCEDCRDCMRSEEYKTLFRSRTLILTAQPESQLRILRPLPEVMEAHHEQWP